MELEIKVVSIKNDGNPSYIDEKENFTVTEWECHGFVGNEEKDFTAKTLSMKVVGQFRPGFCYLGELDTYNKKTPKWKVKTPRQDDPPTFWFDDNVESAPVAKPSNGLLPTSSSPPQAAPQYTMQQLQELMAKCYEFATGDARPPTAAAPIAVALFEAAVDCGVKAIEKVEAQHDLPSDEDEFPASDVFDLDEVKAETINAAVEDILTSAGLDVRVSKAFDADLITKSDIGDLYAENEERFAFCKAVNDLLVKVGA